MSDSVSTTSTTWGVGRATPIVLRETTRTRLVFKPTLIENNRKNPQAYVSGTFVFQVKKPSGRWQDYDTPIKLNALRDGDGVRLELDSTETLILYRELSNLYSLAEAHGVKQGRTEYVVAPQDATLRRLLTSGEFHLLGSDEKVELLGAFLSWLEQSETIRLAEHLANASGGDLADFDAAIGAARLGRVLQELRDNLRNPQESHWQTFLKENTWVISQVFAQPFVIVEDQAYVGGKGIDNKGGNVADFLFRNTATTNAAVVEIKTPATSLLATKVTRNTAYPPSAELSAAVAQIQNARDKLKEQYQVLAGDETPKVRAFQPRALLIVGELSLSKLTPTQHRSFELYRGAMPSLDIVTFDELGKKIRLLLDVLTA